MSVELKEFKENDKTFLAVGYIEEDHRADLKWRAFRASGENEWFWEYYEALNFIAEGLKKPTGWTLED